VIFAFAVALLVCAATLPMLIRLLRRSGAVDVPNSRSSHDVPTPRGAGIALVFAFVSSCVVVSFSGAFIELWWLVPVTVMALTGGIDDFHPLPAVPRLLIQLSVGLLSAWLLIEDGPLTSLFWVAAAGVFLVAFTNAFNFMDGINGISGLTAIVGGLWFAWLGHVEGERSLMYMGAALAGASLGFLPFNFPRARIFLGDSGSYAVGFLLAMLAIVAAQHVDPWPTAFAPLVVYSADTGSTLVSRMRNGDPLLVAHRDHVYQALTRRWRSHTSAALFVLACTVSSCALAIAGYANGSVLLQLFNLVLISTFYVLGGRSLLKCGSARV